MADENIHEDEIDGEEDALLDQPMGSEHSAFLPDEELHDQLPDEAEGDERTALTAAHQGARGTTTPADNAAAFNQAGDFDLLDEASERVVNRANAPAREFDDPLSGNPALDNLANFDSELSGINGEVAQNVSQGGGRAAALATERGFANTDTARANTGDEPQINDGDAGPTNTGSSSSAAGTDEELSLNVELPGATDASSGNEGLGDDGDQSGQQIGAGSDDDTEEYYESDDQTGDQEVAAGEEGGGGVNPIIGDKFDNNLVGTDGRDMINAQDGDDTASGGAGDDLIMGKKGDDWLEGGLGDDTLKGGHGDDTFAFSDGDFDGNAWTDVVDGQGQSGKASSDYDTIDLSNVTQGWTLEVDGGGAGAEATHLSNPTQYTEGGGEFSGTITFADGSEIVFDNIEKVDW